MNYYRLNDLYELFKVKRCMYDILSHNNNIDDDDDDDDDDNDDDVDDFNNLDDFLDESVIEIKLITSYLCFLGLWFSKLINLVMKWYIQVIN